MQKNAIATEISEDIPEIYIKAVNPGYKVDGVSNVGEMIEIARKSSDAPISLAGMTVGYTNSSGKFSVLVEFSEYSFMTGETVLLRLASSQDSELANLNYKISGSSSGIAQGAGPLVLAVNGEIIDSVCWNGEEGCYRKFKTGSLESLVRNLETGEFEFVQGYEPKYEAGSYLVEEVKEEGYGGGVSQCKGMEFSEILSYYDVAKTEQFIELYNSSSETILLDGCQVRYKNKNYDLKGLVTAEGYLAYYPEGFNLTKNPTNSNTLELIDADGTVLDTLVYPNGQRKGAAYAMIGYDGAGQELWRVTYAPTPGQPNNYQEFKTCEEGKVINEVTGNCVKVAEVKTTVCKEGQYLNVLTGRCKKIETKEEKVCKEGYYLNPETNRCRKIRENDGAKYDLEAEKYEEKTSFVALYAVLGVVGVGGVYLVYEFRREIAKLWRKVCRQSR